MVITGGSSPASTYEQLVEAVGNVGIDVRGTHFWFSDERCVAPDDERSNFRMAKQSLFDPLGDDNQPVVHRMQGELGPEKGADEYERELQEAGNPRFDLVLLGLGPDGHLASLFPDQPTLQERSRPVVGVEQAGLEPFVSRISLTFPRLVEADSIVFLVSGESKADAVAAAFGPNAHPDPHVPSSLIASMAEEIVVLLDSAAAARL
jgi:6-phosphogluconolactonase